MRFMGDEVAMTRVGFYFSVACFWASTVVPAIADDLKVHFTGVGFSQAGKIVRSSDSSNNGAENNFNGNWNQATGALLVADATIDENWSGAFGVGTGNFHLSRGGVGYASNWYPFWVPFVTQANITYKQSIRGDDKAFSIKLGSLPYNYNKDSRNLGLYLLRGYVYPGIVVSGFEGKEVSGIATVFGGIFGIQWGALTNDFIVNSETENRPWYDISIADVANFKVSDAFEIGAGVNFYRLIPEDSKVTAPGKDCDPSSDFGAYVQTNPGCYIQQTKADGSIDTITGSLAGTKAMVRFRLDTKALLGFQGPLGKNDLVLYGETAILGFKNYPVFYNDIKRRIPVMLGFNLPAFDFLDFAALEIEYYANKNYQDIGTAEVGSWVPRTVNNYNNGRDDWKWAFNVAKVLGGHVKLAGQIANDHFRPGGFHDKSTGAEAFSTPKDWYWMGKLAFFF
jgi:hypothetical protein